jgi:hypothetical protein
MCGRSLFCKGKYSVILIVAGCGHMVRLVCAVKMTAGTDEVYALGTIQSNGLERPDSTSGFLSCGPI